MKRVNNNNNNNNNKYRNNNNYNQNYSLSYRFDSSSPAGKTCGTALELIKKYNDLAKDAYSNGDYITSEVFRQYAEHYRKIVTEINERRNNGYQNRYDRQNNQSEEQPAAAAEPLPVACDVVETIEPQSAPTPEKREFKVIEIADVQETSRPKRTYRRKEEATAPAL